MTLAEEDYDRPSIPKTKWKLTHKYEYASLSLFIGFLAVIISVAIDAYVFGDGTFLGALLSPFFRQQIFRVQLFGAFALSAVLISRSLTNRRKAEERLSALNMCGRKLNCARNLDEIYELTLAAMEVTLGFEYAAFMLAEDRKLVVVRERGFEIPSSFSLPLDGTMGGLTVRAALQHKAVLAPDVTHDLGYVKPSSFSSTIRSEIAVPLMVEDEVLGVLNAESKKIKAFDNNDVVLLQILASHAATAIANLKAQNQIRAYANQLETAIERKTDELSAAQNKLIVAQRLAAIGELAGMVGHDLRNPLTGISGAAYYLDKNYGSKIDAKGKEMLEIIQKNIQYSDKIINDLLDYSREIKLELAETDPKSLLDEALSAIDVPSNIRVLDKMKKNPKMKADLAKIRRVFTNIMRNAIEAMPSGGELTVVSSSRENEVTISVSDTGTGISKEILDKLWNPLFTTKAKGMGFGLPICKRIVEAHKGNISVKSICGKGTTFAVSLPLEPALPEHDGISIALPLTLETRKA